MARPAARVSLSQWINRGWYWFWKTFILIVARLAFRLRIEGRGYEPRQGPFLVAGNHASLLDPPLVGVGLRHQSAYMAKDELFSIPILGPWLRSTGSFPVKRGTADRKAIRRSFEVLEQGGVLVIFPEGSRSTDGRLRNAEPGAAMIALRTGVKVLPAAVINSHRVLQKGKFWPNFARVTVRYGPLIDVPKIEGRLDHATLNEWGNRFMDAIERLLPPDQHRAR